MKYSINVLFWLLVVPCICRGQSAANFSKTWIQGDAVQYKTVFNGTQVTNSFFDTTNSRYLSAGNSCISDSMGKLVLYSDGLNIYDSNTNVLDGGDTLSPVLWYIDRNGASYQSQSSIFLPFDSGIYYFINPVVSDSLFEASGSEPTVVDLLLCSRIDMKANNGTGKVVRRMQPLMQNARIELVQMMACRHANGKDWWLLKQGKDSNTVYKFLFKQDTILGPYVQTFSQPDFGLYYQGGQSVFSPDGTKYATTNRGAGRIFIADFDRCTGLLSNPIVTSPVPAVSIHDPDSPSLVEPAGTATECIAYSPNGRFLYVSRYDNIQQLDLQDTDTATQWSNVGGLDTTWDYFQQYSAIYLGPDNKIYIGNWDGFSDAMSVIDSPDNKGVACGFCPRCLRFTPYVYYTGYTIMGVSTPPCMPNYGLGASSELCPEEVTEIPTADFSLKLYPNPTTGLLNIAYSLHNNEYGIIEITDIYGRVVISISLDNDRKTASAEMDRYASGIYYYRYIVNGVQQQAGKIALVK